MPITNPFSKQRENESSARSILQFMFWKLLWWKQPVWIFRLLLLFCGWKEAIYDFAREGNFYPDTQNMIFTTEIGNWIFHSIFRPIHSQSNGHTFLSKRFVMVRPDQPKRNIRFMMAAVRRTLCSMVHAINATYSPKAEKICQPAVQFRMHHRTRMMALSLMPSFKRQFDTVQYSVRSIVCHIGTCALCACASLLSFCWAPYAVALCWRTHENENK